MKRLPGSQNSNSVWYDGLVNELAFIKKHLRYPMKGGRLFPFIVWGLFLTLIPIFIYLVVSSTDSRKPNSLGVLVALSGSFMVVGILIAYVRSLRFVQVSSPYTLAENISVMKQFLLSKHIAAFTHPDIPEVCAIQSRNLSLGKEDREVVIFIADDNRILINSHFIRSGWSPPAGSQHHKQMAKGLIDFINAQTRNTGIMHQTF